jgi:hypothetical protein
VRDAVAVRGDRRVRLHHVLQALERRLGPLTEDEVAEGLLEALGVALPAVGDPLGVRFERRDDGLARRLAGADERREVGPLLVGQLVGEARHDPAGLAQLGHHAVRADAGLVEVGAGRAGRGRRLKRVAAGAALGREQLLARDRIAVLGRVVAAAGQRAQRRQHDERGADQDAPELHRRRR